VRENVFAAAVWRDKAETLTVVEPFDCTCTHVSISMKCKKTGFARPRELQGGIRRSEEYRLGGCDDRQFA
jgi:hypothetical protein